MLVAPRYPLRITRHVGDELYISDTQKATEDLFSGWSIPPGLFLDFIIITFPTYI